MLLLLQLGGCELWGSGGVGGAAERAWSVTWEGGCWPLRLSHTEVHRSCHRHSGELHLTQQASLPHVCTCICTRTQACMHMQTYTCHWHTHSCKCVCTHVCAHTHVHAHRSLSQALVVVCLTLSPRQRTGDWLWPVMQGHDWNQKRKHGQGVQTPKHVQPTTPVGQVAGLGKPTRPGLASCCTSDSVVPQAGSEQTQACGSRAKKTYAGRLFALWAIPRAPSAPSFFLCRQ